MITSHIKSSIMEECEKNLEEVFTSTDETLREMTRKIYVVDADRAPKLKTLCLYVISETFDQFDNFTRVSTLPQQDFNFLMEIISTDLHLKYTIKVIEDENYWKRCCTDKWPDRVFNSNRCPRFWKELYLRKLLQDKITETIPGDEQSIVELVELIHPFIFEIKLTHFQVNDLENANEEIKDHLALNNILKELVNLRVFTLHGNIDFALSSLDWDLLLSGLESLSDLSQIAIINCKLNKFQWNKLVNFVLSKNCIEELNVSHCDLSEEIVALYGNILRQHDNLKVLRLCDNQINDRGIQALSYCISEKYSAPLEVLDISLNMLSHLGTCFLAAALVRCKEKPKELNVSGCGFTELSAIVFSECLEYNTSLRNLNISANNFSQAETPLLLALIANKNLIKIDTRFSEISDESVAEIEIILKRNNNSHDEIEIDPIPETFALNEPEYLVWEYNPYNPDHEPGHYSNRLL